MTNAARTTAQRLKTIGIRLTRTDYGEYRVALTALSGDRQEAGAYYTSDLADAEATGRYMAREYAASQVSILAPIAAEYVRIPCTNRQVWGSGSRRTWKP